jgi:hypothetical protein
MWNRAAERISCVTIHQRRGPYGILRFPKLFDGRVGAFEVVIAAKLLKLFVMAI